MIENCVTFLVKIKTKSVVNQRNTHSQMSFVYFKSWIFLSLTFIFLKRIFLTIIFLANRHILGNGGCFLWVPLKFCTENCCTPDQNWPPCACPAIDSRVYQPLQLRERMWFTPIEHTDNTSTGFWSPSKHSIMKTFHMAFIIHHRELHSSSWNIGQRH